MIEKIEKIKEYEFKERLCIRLSKKNIGVKTSAVWK